MEGKKGEKVWEEERETKGRTGRVGVSEGEGGWELKAAPLQAEGWRNSEQLLGLIPAKSKTRSIILQTHTSTAGGSAAVVN